MKKFKGIFGILVMITGILGTGYAYWMDSLQVYATVSTGTFDVQYCEEHTEGDTDGVSVLEVDIDEGIADIRIDKIAPGCELSATLCFKNEGSVNAILNQIRIDSLEYDDECDVVEYRAEIGENIISGNNLALFEEEAEKLLDMLKLGSGECKSIIITVFIPYDEEQYQKGQDKSCKFEIIFDWRQDISVNGSSTGTTVTEPAVTEPQVTNPPVAEPPAINPPATEPEVVEPPASGLPQIDAPAVIEPEVVKPVKDKDRNNSTDGEKFSKAVFSGGGASSGGGGGGGTTVRITPGGGTEEPVVIEAFGPEEEVIVSLPVFSAEEPEEVVLTEAVMSPDANPQTSDAGIAMQMQMLGLSLAAMYVLKRKI